MDRDRIVVVSDEDLRSGSAALVLRHVEAAFEARGRVERCDVATAAGLRRQSRGFEKVRTTQTIVAFGHAAHVGLSDFEKRSVFPSALGLERADVDPGQMVWSCINTVRAVALGDAAWRSMQVLPIEAVSRHAMPPLAVRNADHKWPELPVRIIRHEARMQAATAAVRLRDAGFEVVETDDWQDEAAIHVHVGSPGHDGNLPRPIDSLASGRLVIQVPSPGKACMSPDEFKVEDQANGIVCHSAREIAAACEEVRADPTYFDKLFKSGFRTAAPLLKGWGHVAEAILA